MHTHSTMWLDDMMRLTRWISENKRGRRAGTVSIVAAEGAATRWLREQAPHGEGCCDER